MADLYVKDKATLQRLTLSSDNGVGAAREASGVARVSALECREQCHAADSRSGSRLGLGGGSRRDVTEVLVWSDDDLDDHDDDDDLDDDLDDDDLEE